MKTSSLRDLSSSARLFVWTGGALFVASLGVCAHHYLVVWGWPSVRAGDLGPHAARWIVAGHVIPFGAIAADVLLLTLFAAHHSIFARDPVKTWLAGVIPTRLIRSVYVWIASLLLIGVCLLWRPIGVDLYDGTGLRAFAHAAVQLAGLWIIARAVGGLDPLELAGIHPSSGSSALQTSGPFRWVRHPLYLGWVIAVFGAAHMTGDRLAFAATSSLYLVIAVPWEERSLRKTFGEDYARYVRAVRWRIIPFVY
jgi:protein-S-isoprenylcysteine O-methyltransferase Ste14